MTDIPFQFESLFYYKEGNDYYIKNPAFRTVWQKIHGYEKFNIYGSRYDKDTFRLKDTDSDKLSLIFTELFNKKISKEEIEQHAGKPIQPQATKTVSAPTNSPKQQTQPPPPPQKTSTSNSQTNQMTASKSPSAPVTKSTTEVIPPINNEFTFDNLYYYIYENKSKNETGYAVISEEFSKRYQAKSIYSKFNIRGKKIQNKKGVYLIMSNDPEVISKIFTDIFETPITKQQIIDHTKKSPDTLPPLPVNKTPSTPSAPSAPLPSKPTPQAFKSASTNDSFANKSSPQNPDQSIPLTNMQYEKLICLLGAPSWLSSKYKGLSLRFEPNSEI